jgi:hypothetical protein
MTLLPKYGEPILPQVLMPAPFTAQVPVTVLSSLSQRDGDRLKKAGARIC